jgi:hypothetical protein
MTQDTEVKEATTERTPTLWTHNDMAERINATTIAEAVEEWADAWVCDNDGPLPETVTLYGFAPRPFPDPSFFDDFILEGLIERLDEDHGDPEEPTEITDAMRTACREFVAKVYAEFRPWMCEIVTEQTVRVADYYTPSPEPSHVV